VNAQRWQLVKVVLNHALELQGEARALYLEQVTADDSELRVELDSLIAAHDESAESFLNLPAAAMKLGGDSATLYASAVVGNYRLLSEIGQGGMGQVWLAEQTAPVCRLVALKLIRAGMYDDNVLQRFQTERQSLAIMDHPAIAKVFDAGSTPQGQPYLVMEYVAGIAITEYCDKKKLNIRARIELFLQACDGVQHAHQKAIIHRDLKPANILIVEVDGKAVPRIIDFGLARPAARAADQPHHTQFGQFIGTPGYMSPEQIDPNVQDIDTRTDVYSLGVILYVLLTGMQPFEMKGQQRPPLDKWVHQLREEEPPSLSAKLNSDRGGLTATAEARSTEPKQLTSLLRGDLEWITAKALERERERRYGTPSELAAELRRYLNHEPVAAGPASAVYRIRKFARRHRVAAIIGATTTVLAIVASGAGLVAVQQKREAIFQTSQALQAQARLLTQAAAQRLKDADLPRAQSIILEVLTNPALAQARTPAAASVFQDVRAADWGLAVLAGHGDWVWRAAYSPDGTRIVTASVDKTARIWDAATGASLIILSGHSGSVRGAAYSPDGFRVITASRDKTVRIWDAHTGSLVGELKGHEAVVFSAVYSPDGTRILSASGDKTARIWNAATGAEILRLAGHSEPVFSAAFSPDGTRIVTASGDKTARIWDALSGRALTTLSGHGGPVYSAVYSPNGGRIITASLDKTARVWDSTTGATLAVLSGHNEVLYSAAYSPDGARIVTASADKTARVWDAVSGAALGVLSGHGDAVYSASYSPDGTRIITTSADKTARVWDTSMRRVLAVISGHTDIVEAAAFSPDGVRIATASKDKTARVWNSSTGAQLAVLEGHGDVVESVAYSRDGRRIVTGAYGRTARVWDADTGAPILVLTGHDAAVDAATYSPDNTRIVTGSQDKTARVWDATTGAVLAVLTGHQGIVFSAVYSPDGTHIATGSQDKTARVWDARSGALQLVLAGHGAAVECIRYSPDGTRIVTASADRTARIWDSRTGAPVAILIGHDSDVYAANYSPDGLRIVTASADKTARIWDALTAMPLAVLSGHRDIVFYAAYSGDARRIVTASADNSARVWDARISAGLDEQIIWSKAAEFDPLPSAERVQLGLPPDPRVRKWLLNSSPCDQTAAALHDPDRLAPGLLQASVNSDIAIAACTAAAANPGATQRDVYQSGRALLANHDFKGARQRFEQAHASGYRASQVDLANLLLDGSAGMFDAARAVSLYEQAWQSGVQVAAFELGHLYEYGADGRGSVSTLSVQPDLTKAWQWYEKGSSAGEPNALARVAERQQARALAESSVEKRNLLLLQAFASFAAASERAQNEDWPDEVWRGWRYHRATLARLLEREGMMSPLAGSFAVLRQRWTSPPPTLWARIRGANGS
jgi:eukaryotic-like serine/threonine-protein kinase